MADKEVIIDAKINENGAEIKIEKTPKNKKKILCKIANMIDSCGMLLCIIAYVILGTTMNLWHCAWILVFIPNIVSSILRAIGKRKPDLVNVCFVACFAFFFVCMWAPGLKANLWHPMWVVFLIIPMYYIVVHQIQDFRKDD